MRYKLAVRADIFRVLGDDGLGALFVFGLGCDVVLSFIHRRVSVLCGYGFALES